MATEAEIARAQLLLGGTGRWTDDEVEDVIDSEGGVAEACVLLLESAATAAAFEADVKAGSQSVTQSHVAAALRRAAQAIRDDYDLGGCTGSVVTLETCSGRDPLGNALCSIDPSTSPGNWCDNYLGGYACGCCP